jgi:hypothetical protein
MEIGGVLHDLRLFDVFAAILERFPAGRLVVSEPCRDRAGAARWAAARESPRLGDVVPV